MYCMWLDTWYQIKQQINIVNIIISKDKINLLIDQLDAIPADNFK